MSEVDQRGVSRRTFLKTAAVGGAALGAAAALPKWTMPSASAEDAPKGGLNILFIMVDQLRAPYVYMSPAMQKFVCPSITKLADEGVRFDHYYTVSNDCTPARAAQVSGLYTHQIGIFGTTGDATLNPGFPTFGTALREQGYDTYWFGKWHVTPSDVSGAGTINGCMANPYEAYGFTVPDPSVGTCPSPDGGAGQGQFIDPITRQQFREWLKKRPTGEKPWFATLSLINPHDIQFYPYYTRRIQGQQFPRELFKDMAANYETNEQRDRHRKPEIQLSSVHAHNDTFGDLPDEKRVVQPWRKMLDTYALMTNEVDLQIYSALKELSNSPFADNTIVVFTADHGEYNGAHGMRGKGFSFYEEGSRIPLIVKDPTNTWTQDTQAARKQLFSSVDLGALFLTLATGSNDWRNDPRYAHLKKRGDIASALKDPAAKGRPYIAHATDEEATLPPQLGGDGSSTVYPGANHITAIRTRIGKLARYAYWKDGGYEIDASKGIEWEVYDYRTREGRMELDNVAYKPEAQQFVRAMKKVLAHAMQNEIQQPVPSNLQNAQNAAFVAWFGDATATPPVSPITIDNFRTTVT
ncbi:MAG: sulfatase-like hydrolase/transferase [Gaiellales bacterium]